MENEWQPVRIAPIEKWHPKLSRKTHWALQVVGKVVRVSTNAVNSHNCGCACALHQLHPEDQNLLIKGEFHTGWILEAAECQIIPLLWLTSKG